MAQAAMLDVVALEIVDPPRPLELDGNLGGRAVSQGTNGLSGGICESSVAEIHVLEATKRGGGYDGIVGGHIGLGSAVWNHEFDFSDVLDSNCSHSGIVFDLRFELLLHFLGQLLRTAKNAVPFDTRFKVKVQRLEDGFTVGLVIPIGSADTF